MVWLKNKRGVPHKNKNKFCLQFVSSSGTGGGGVEVCVGGICMDLKEKEAEDRKVKVVVVGCGGGVG